MESVKNSITGIFKSKVDEATSSDHLIITVSQVDTKTKERKTVCEGIFIFLIYKY